jgi:hypothetical protein
VPLQVESRWPPVATVLVFMALNIGIRIWLPDMGLVHVPFLVPALEAVLLVVIATWHPTSPAE